MHKYERKFGNLHRLAVNVVQFVFVRAYQSR